jgi:hypothetical protein
MDLKEKEGSKQAANDECPVSGIRIGGHVYLKSSCLIVKLYILRPFGRRRCLVIVAALLPSVS